jgi:hypothetical protein
LRGLRRASTPARQARQVSTAFHCSSRPAREHLALGKESEGGHHAACAGGWSPADVAKLLAVDTNKLQRELDEIKPQLEGIVEELKDNTKELKDNTKELKDNAEKLKLIDALPEKEKDLEEKKRLVKKDEQLRKKDEQLRDEKNKLLDEKNKLLDEKKVTRLPPSPRSPGWRGWCMGQRVRLVGGQCVGLVRADGALCVFLRACALRIGDEAAHW